MSITLVPGDLHPLVAFMGTALMWYRHTQVKYTKNKIFLKLFYSDTQKEKEREYIGLVLSMARVIY